MNRAAPDDHAWYVGLPKAEVHVHLEGCIEPDVLATAADANGVELPPDVREPKGFSGLGPFLAHLDLSCRLITLPEHVELLGYRFVQRLARNGTRYADLIVNPTHWPAWTDRFGAFLDALDAGLAAGEAEAPVAVRVCPSLKRTQSREAALDFVAWLTALDHPRVVALSIDGNEAAEGRSGDRFAPAFASAADRGLRRCAHAGESSGPEGVRDAIDLLGAERIDHGVRSIEDPALVAELAARRVPLDVCPTSNVLLGLFRSHRDHPIDALRRAGVRVSLNTDDPVLFGSDLANEYHRCATTFGWTVAEVGAIARTSIEASFAAELVKAALLGDLDRYLADADTSAAD